MKRRGVAGPVDGPEWKPGARGFYIDITDAYEDDLQRTLDAVVDDIVQNRSVISQAIGMVRLVHDVSEEQAMKALKWVSSQTNTKVRDIAAQLVSDAKDKSIVAVDAKTEFDRLLPPAPRRVSVGGHRH